MYSDWRLKNIKLYASPIYGDRYIKTKIKTYGDEVYTNFRGLYAPDDYDYKIMNKQRTDYLDDNPFETDE